MSSSDVYHISPHGVPRCSFVPPWRSHRPSSTRRRISAPAQIAVSSAFTQRFTALRHPRPSASYMPAAIDSYVGQSTGPSSRSMAHPTPTIPPCMQKRRGSSPQGGNEVNSPKRSHVSFPLAPNDPKLSDCGGRRSLCGKAAGAGLRVGAQAVTPGAVRCSAWFDVAGASMELSHASQCLRAPPQ